MSGTLTFTKPYGGVLAPRTTFDAPDALPRIARFDAAHPRRRTEDGTPVAPLLAMEYERRYHTPGRFVTSP